MWRYIDIRNFISLSQYGNYITIINILIILQIAIAIRCLWIRTEVYGTASAAMVAALLNYS